MVSVSQMKALKRHRRDWFDGFHSAGQLPPGPHAPAKAEARLLRRLCSTTGLTEEQVREHKTYRRMLAEATKPKQGRGEHYRRAVRVRKAVAAKTGLHPLHPEFLPAFEAAWNDAVRYLRSRLQTPSARAALELSLSKA